MYIYKLKRNGILELDGAFFPQISTNGHYLQYLKRINDGTAIVEHDYPKVSLDSIRGIRNRLLQESDAYMMSDFPRGSATLSQIKEYRQSLRDFTNEIDLTNISEIKDVNFPKNPISN